MEINKILVVGAGVMGSGITQAFAQRGYEVLMLERSPDLVAKGLTNREIGEQLHIGENTVKNHLRNILDKLHLNNRAQAAAFAVRHGLIKGKLRG